MNATKTEAPKKNCFVICPIGEEGDEIRKRSDQVFEYVISPVVKEMEYSIQRADRISEPGMITSQIIDKIFNDELVIADLTGNNPNVLYEIAVRHMVKKPIVQLIHTTDKIPFDVAASRTIRFDYHDLSSVDNCKKELKKQISAVEKDPSKVDSPITHSIMLNELSKSSDPIAKSNEEILSILNKISIKNDQLSVLVESILVAISRIMHENNVDIRNNLLNRVQYKQRLLSNIFNDELCTKPMFNEQNVTDNEQDRKK